VHFLMAGPDEHLWLWDPIYRASAGIGGFLAYSHEKVEKVLTREI
jgi:hypothetical protein